MGFFQYGAIVEQLATTVTATGTTALVNTSKQNQVFTGTLGQIVVLPNATTMSVGQFFNIYNQSSGSLTLQFFGGAAFTDASGLALGSILAHTSIIVTLQTNGTSAGTWTAFSSAGAVVGTIPILQGGTGQTTASAAFNALSPMTTTGDMEYEVDTGTAARLPIGTLGETLIVSNGTFGLVPSWGLLTGAGIANSTITGSNIANLTVTPSNLVASPIQVSGSSGVMPVTGTQTIALTCPALVTTGRPVLLSIQADGTNATTVTITAGSVSVLLYRGATQIADYATFNTTGDAIDFGLSWNFVDFNAGGSPGSPVSNVYSVQVVGSDGSFDYYQLVAYEL